MADHDSADDDTADDAADDRSTEAPSGDRTPFDDLDPDEYGDREGDPFANLAGDSDAGDGDAGDDAPVSKGDASDENPVSDASSADDHETTLGGDDPREPDPFEYLGGPESRDPTGADDGDAAADTTRSTADRNRSGSSDSTPAEPFDVGAVDDPLGDVDAGRGDPFESPDNPFERVDVGGADPDAVWAQFTGDVQDADRSDAVAGGSGAAAESGTAVESGAAVEADDATVDDRVDDDVVDVSKHRFCERCPHFSAPPDVECGHPGTAILEFVGTDDVRVSNCPVVSERRELGEVHESR